MQENDVPEWLEKPTEADDEKPPHMIICETYFPPAKTDGVKWIRRPQERIQEYAQD